MDMERELVIVEDNAGGLWLYGTDSDNNAVHYGDLQNSAKGTGVAELIVAWRDGIAGWEHGQDNDFSVDEDPRYVAGSQVIAEYDGVRLVLHPVRMGYAGSDYFGLPSD